MKYGSNVNLLLRNLFFTILQPGIVAGYVPYLILKNKLVKIPVHLWNFYQYSGLFIFVIGLIVMFSCIISFAVHGRGTLSPADPTKRLVIKGLYKFSRNPMYIGVILILAGEALFFLSSYLLIYLLLIFIAFHIFILLHEEPRMKKVFKDEYDDYYKKVKRWL